MCTSLSHLFYQVEIILLSKVSKILASPAMLLFGTLVFTIFTHFFTAIVAVYDSGNFRHEPRRSYQCHVRTEGIDVNFSFTYSPTQSINQSIKEAGYDPMISWYRLNDLICQTWIWLSVKVDLLVHCFMNGAK